MSKIALQRVIANLFIICFLVQNSTAQKTSSLKKYPSVMWEISGNGLKKKAYLFGTMHVSSKLAFNLSDSFYNAINACDAVALENDPSTWQQEYLDSWFNRISSLYTLASERVSDDYINKSTFQFTYSDADLKTALSSDPEVINHFLYRNFMGNADFEENTYLDMHIYQCSQKLNKQFFGLENFRESEALMLQAIKTQAGESKRKSRSTEAEEDANNNNQTSLEKIQDAYRKGNLDLLDSLAKKDMQSEGFYEFFLYKRNEIHANEIAKILQKNIAVFAAVGAMHLAGNRGVIELLRAKGYKLRPISMGIQMSKKRDEINKLKINRTLQKEFANDSLFSVNVPGKLYNFSYAGTGLSNQWVNADFGNGAYYMVTRVATQGNLWDYNQQRMFLKVDSLLYENIPGKILEKKEISINGYKGFDITNKTRKGDVQRYNIFITPLELIVFKMSGFEDYVQGKEGDEFFNSISFKPIFNSWDWFTPEHGGFKVQTPHKPISNNGNSNNLGGYFAMLMGGSSKSKGYECYDAITKTHCFILPKTIANYKVLEEDTFNLALCAESLSYSNIFLAPSNRIQASQNNTPYLQLSGKCADGDNYINRFYIVGTDYYLLISKFKNTETAANKFLQSFTPTDFVYRQNRTYTDSSLHFKVSSPLALDSISTEFLKITRLAKKVEEEDNKTSKTVAAYDKSEEKFIFRNDSTNEEIIVLSKAYGKYTYIKDTTKFWEELCEEQNIKAINENYWDFYEKEKSINYQADKSICNLILADTNSSQNLCVKFILNKGRLFTLYTLTNSLQPMSKAKKQFFDSFAPLYDSSTTFSLFTPKGSLFFTDFNSKDSVTSKFAQKYITRVKFVEDDIPAFKQSLAKLNPKGKDYFTDKANFIKELGYLNKTDDAANYLKEIYTVSADTATFQNQCILALANLKTQKSFNYVSEILINDPPVFEDEDDTRELFRSFSDTLLLTKTILPNLLPLASIDDYKWRVFDLLTDFIDSNYIKIADFENIYSKIYFDARREQKKLSASDEKLANKKQNEDDDDDESYNYYYKGYDNDINDITTYNKLLLPFWDKNASVQSFLNKNLQFKKTSIKFATAKLLAKYKKPVADSVWASIAEDEKYRLDVYNYFKENTKLHLFPKQYVTQELMAKLILQSSRKKDSLEFLNKSYTATIKSKTGMVYFFKYKNGEKDVDWKIALTGLQPINKNEINSDETLVEHSDKILKTNIPLEEQLTKFLKEELYGLRRSSSNFFDKKSDYNNVFSSLK